MKNLFSFLAVAGWLAGTPLAAQTSPKPRLQVFDTEDVAPCSVDLLTVQEYIEHQAKYPPETLKKQPSGQVNVEFVLDATGKSRDAKLRKTDPQLQEELGETPPDPAVVAAVLAAIKTLPRQPPVLLNGKPVALRVPLTIRYPAPGPWGGRQPGTAPVYTYVEQMPEMPGGGGLAALVAAITKNLVRPAPVAGQPTGAGKVFVSFVVGTDGVVRDAKVVKSLAPAADAAVLAAVRKLPALRPGKQNGCPVAVAFTVPVPFE